MKKPNDPKRILVIMLRRIGDVLLTTPAVRALKKLYPNAQIDFLVEPPAHELLEGNSDIQSILIYDSREKPGIFGPAAVYVRWLRRIRNNRYDWVIDYMGNPRSAIITAFSTADVRAGPGHASHRWAYSHRLIQSDRACYTALEKIRVLRSLGLHPDESDFLPTLNVPNDSFVWAKSILQAPSPQPPPLEGRGTNISPSPSAGGHEQGVRPLSWSLADMPAKGQGEGPWIGFVPASRKITRRWPAASYARLGQMLRDRSNARILVFWGPGEKALARDIARGIGPNAAAAPETKSLKNLAALIGQCSLVVANCNGPKHIAVALGVPTLTIHGSSDPAIWNPPNQPDHRTIRLDDLFCIGCRLNRCPYDLECMKTLTPERVSARAEQMLAAQGACSHGPR